jgi:hypothetical protein
MKLPLTSSVFGFGFGLGALGLGALGLGALACDNAAPVATPGVSGDPTAATMPAAPPAPATPATPTAAKGAGSPEGGECGDDVAIQKKCAAGLVCAPNPKVPVSEHTPGICKKP